MLNEYRGFKFVITLLWKFRKIINKDLTRYTMFCLNSNAGKVIYDTEINSIFESVYIKIIKKIRKYQVEDSD